MNRRLLLQVTSPAVLISLVLLAACVAGGWYSSRIVSNLNAMRKKSTAALLSAKDLVIHLRQLRYHCLLYLDDPTPGRLRRVDEDEEKFGRALDEVKTAVQSGQEQERLEIIERGYKQFRSELDQLERDVRRPG